MTGCFHSIVAGGPLSSDDSSNGPDPVNSLPHQDRRRVRRVRRLIQKPFSKAVVVGVIPDIRNPKYIVETTDAPDDSSHFHVGRHLSVRRAKISATGYAAGITGVRLERRVRGGPRPLQSSRGCTPLGRFGGRDGYPHGGAKGATPGRSRARTPGGLDFGKVSPAAVFVKEVVASTDHAALEFGHFSGWLCFGGFSHTSVTGFQFLVGPDQRLGLRCLAAS